MSAPRIFHATPGALVRVLPDHQYGDVQLHLGPPDGSELARGTRTSVSFSPADARAIGELLIAAAEWLEAKQEAT